jgi:hypothetical protein
LARHLARDGVFVQSRAIPLRHLAQWRTHRTQWMPFGARSSANQRPKREEKSVSVAMRRAAWRLTPIFPPTWEGLHFATAMRKAAIFPRFAGK